MSRYKAINKDQWDQEGRLTWDELSDCLCEAQDFWSDSQLLSHCRKMKETLEAISKFHMNKSGMIGGRAKELAEEILKELYK